MAVRPIRSRTRSSYLTNLALTAGLVISGLGASTDTVLAASSHSIQAGTVHPASRAIAFALAQLGKPYQWGGNGPRSYDCSGLVQQAYLAAHIDLPRTAEEQYAALPHVALTQVMPGDLVFFAYNVKDPRTIHHVGIYLGDGRMLDAPHTGAFVRVEPVWRQGLVPLAARPAPLTVSADPAVARAVARIDATPVSRGAWPIPPGATGQNVAAAQALLDAHGYNLDIDGIYGVHTYAAVHDFQLRNGLQGTGLIGPRTLRLLVNASASAPAADGGIKGAAATGSGDGDE